MIDEDCGKKKPYGVFGDPSESRCSRVPESKEASENRFAGIPINGGDNETVRLVVVGTSNSGTRGEISKTRKDKSYVGSESRLLQAGKGDEMTQGINGVGGVPESCEKMMASPSSKAYRVGSGHNPIDVLYLEKLRLSPKDANKPKNEKRRKGNLGPIVAGDKEDCKRTNRAHRFGPFSSRLSKRMRKGGSGIGLGPKCCKRKSVGRPIVRESNINKDTPGIGMNEPPVIGRGMPPYPIFW
ncbi:hypothetical protein Ancab_019602 [Ancistrocladus abbreviatus]